MRSYKLKRSIKLGFIAGALLVSYIYSIDLGKPEYKIIVIEQGTK